MSSSDSRVRSVTALVAIAVGALPLAPASTVAGGEESRPEAHRSKKKGLAVGPVQVLGDKVGFEAGSAVNRGAGLGP